MDSVFIRKTRISSNKLSLPARVKIPLFSSWNGHEKARKSKFRAFSLREDETETHYNDLVDTSSWSFATNSATVETVCSPVLRERTETVFSVTSFSPMTSA